MLPHLINFVSVTDAYNYYNHFEEDTKIIVNNKFYQLFGVLVIILTRIRIHEK